MKFIDKYTKQEAEITIDGVDFVEVFEAGEVTRYTVDEFNNRFIPKSRYRGCLSAS